MLKFKYTKANGEVSERYGLIVTPKSDMALMLDLSGLTEETRKNMELDWNEYKLLQEDLWERYNFSKFLKNFKEENISNREVV